METPTKTPVSRLQEICTRKNINPKYELLQVEGAVHEPTFQYRLSVEHNGTEFEETGSGRSKKEAKHNTALAMLVAMGIQQKDTDGNEEEAPPELDLSGDGDLVGNPVGVLQELCMKMKLPPPTYEVHSEEGLPHERIFALACKVGEHYVEVGRGKSKKLAKRQAAHLMGERLRNIPSETTNVFAYDEDDDKIISGLVACIAANKKKGNSNSELEIAGNLLTRSQNMAMEKIPVLQDPDLVIDDPVTFLDKFESLNFKIIYIDFDELGSTGLHQHFVQITSDPPTVAIGEGLTKEEAKVNAALDALSIFRELISSAD